MKRNKEIITFGGNPVTLIGDLITVGKQAPEFRAIDKDMNEKKLLEYIGKKLVVSVMPSVDTPVCATQTRTFNKMATSMNDNTIILTISMDLPFALNRFCAAEGIENVITLSDYKYKEFGEKYGFLIEELMLLARGIVIIDTNRIVRYVEYVKEATNEPNYNAALEILNII
ncbi:MAG: thiol peroxidase [Bacteroidales bacterium]|jgi:thiol peroxidase|nr:thiol peroxidase [Bacteroidales bacterium]MCB5245942.1 thiol peroxidase [Candidatus Cloacimonadota bacterium]MDI9576162.1 thiol peroxidase [Bacteroidota bacterium]MDD2593489.1 thiol peroxidase [Bacteroidales bacterium]MDY0401531.1 thiol peroxidase [Bacteroidales bacterium]